jgi:hypothetical protein
LISKEIFITKRQNENDIPQQANKANFKKVDIAKLTTPLATNFKTTNSKLDQQRSLGGNVNAVGK